MGYVKSHDNEPAAPPDKNETHVLGDVFRYLFRWRDKLS